MDLKTLKEKCKEFEEREGRASFYDIALKIVEEYLLQASIIILATWNISRFRFIVSNSKNLIDLENSIEKCKPLFNKIKNANIQKTNLDEIKDTIIQIYNTLSKVKGVEYTGASKVMHLLNRNLVVVWDSYIRKEFNYKDANAETYFDFLKKMQEKFKNIEWEEQNKTLAKAIDEYNYVVISLPELEKQRNKKTN